MIKENVCKIESRIGEIVAENGIGQSVTLIAVTKNQPEGVFAQLSASGITHFAENRVQALVERAPLMNGTRHLIGHLQTNKVRKALLWADLIQSVDSFHLAKEISRCAEAEGKTQNVLIQVNVAREEQKFGVSEDGLDVLLQETAQLPHINICGLMAIMPKETKDAYYQRMYELFQYYTEHPYPGIEMKYLSMGMSGDYETAVRFGANMVRIGRGLYV